MKLTQGKTATLKARCCFVVAVLALLSFSVSSYAFHPITKDSTMLGVYPTYPTVDYGSGNQAKLIKRGEYLAKAGDCIACHTDTANNGAAYAGGLAIETPFGTFYSPNITPDKETGIGKWTEKDFINAMQNGTAPDGSNYFPVLPYLYFTKTSKDDLRALLAYLQALPAVKQKNKTLPFPFDVPGARLALYGWKLLFFYKHRGEFKYNASKSAEWNRGKYLVSSLGHCGMCHTPTNALGGAKWRYYLTGSFIDDYWAPNITNYGLKTASRYEVADIFIDNQLINKAGPIEGPMAEVNHDSLKYLSQKDRLAIATYLKSVKSTEPYAISPSEKQPTLKRGEQVYANVCTICHQDGKVGAPLIGDDAGWKMRVDTQGLPALYRHAINGYNKMPPKGACVTCSDNDIKAAVDYLIYKSLSREQLIQLKNPTQKKPSEESGKLVYQEHCSLCHNEGKLGAPKIGDKTVWAPLIRKNMDVLILNTIAGLHNMPPKGGCKHCSNSEIIAATKYLVQQSSPEGDNFSLW